MKRIYFMNLFCWLLMLATNDVVAQAIEAVAPMVQARGDFTSTLLDNGKVLITSGWTQDGQGCPGRGQPLPSAELFDPVTKTFTTTNPMVYPRWEHSAIKLLDSRVLVMGGASGCVNDFTYAATAEIYDPVTNSFTATGSMSTTRKAFPVALEDTGSVLVFGGTKEGSFASATNTVERWSPITNQFTLAGAMAVERGEHAVCRLSNTKYLLVGGTNYYNDSSPARNRSAEIFSTVSGTSTLLAKKTVFVHQSDVKAEMLKNGKCLISSYSERGLAVELFNPKTKTFKAIAAVPGYDGQSTQQTSISKLADGRILLSPYPLVVYNPDDGSVSKISPVDDIPIAGSQATTLKNFDVLLSSGFLQGAGLPNNNAFLIKFGSCVFD